MLGDKLGDEKGEVKVQRVLPGNGGGPKVETTFEAAGKILDVKHKTIGTYVAVVRADGRLYGEGQGILMGEGGEMASWTGSGVGTMKNDGEVSYRGAVYYQSSSPAWTDLNGVAAVFEYEVKADGKTKGEIWEWK